MGFGTAFATGLIKGFTQNIKEEEAKRLSERERLNKLDEFVLKARFDKDSNQTAVTEVAKLIQSARTKMDQRKPIDIFGTASDDIDIDFAKMQTSLFNVGDTDFINIGTYKLKLPESIATRYHKDRSDPLKKSVLQLDALNEQLSTAEGKAEFEKNFKGNINNINALRQFFVPAMNSILAEKRKNNTDPINPENHIANYGYLSGMLGLGVDAKMKNEISVIKAAEVERLNAGTMQGEQPITAEGLVAVSSSLFPTSKVKGGYQMISVNSFKENGIDLGIVDQIAKYQGRDRDVFLSQFSSNYTYMPKFFEALKHTTEIAKIGGLVDGTTLNLTDSTTLANVGDYLDENISDTKLQARVMSGLVGPILSYENRLAIASGRASEEDFKAGTNIEEGFKQVFGTDTSFAAFQTRIQAARLARDQLLEYKSIVAGIPTVKDSILDRTVKLIESFVGGSGTVDQLMDVLGGNFRTEQDKEAIRSRLERIKTTGGERAQRDTLAFIIAANMARAEDQGGRLSDGDIQRNMDKIAPGTTTKGGEMRSIDTVIDSIVSLTNLLSETNNIIQMEGSRGFSVKTQEKIRGLRIRDLAMQNARDRYAEGLIASGRQAEASLNFETASKFSSSEVFNSPSGYNVVDDGRGKLYVIDNQNQRIVASGSPLDLTKGGHVAEIKSTPNSTGAESGGQPAVSPAGGQPADSTDSVGGKPSKTPTPTPNPAMTVVSELSLAEDATLISGTNLYRLPGHKGRWEKRTNDKGESEYIQVSTMD